MTKTTQYDITAIGNAIVDILAFVPDSFLAQHGMTRGAMQLVEADTIAALHKELKESRECSGGSAANTIAAMAGLGAKTCFLGRVAKDPLGELFTQDIRASGVEFGTDPAHGGKPTACCIVCVTPDGERTMNTYIGACSEFTVSDVDAEAIRASRLLYVEGYLWDAEPAKAAITHALDIARQSEVKIAFSASDVFCVSRHHADFLRLIEEHVDFLFANEQEALALFPGVTLEECGVSLSKMVDTVAITRGSDPALILDHGNLHLVSARAVPRIVDATGAGDLFAAGFLHKWLQGASADACAQAGHAMASHIIAQLGARSTTPFASLVA